MAIGDIVANLAINADPWKRGLSEGERSLGDFVTAGIAGLGALAAGYAIVTTAIDKVSASMEVARESAKVTARFNAVIEATGNAAGMTAKQYDKLTDSVSRYAAVAGKDTTNALATLVRFQDIQGAQLERALPLVADLSAAMGMDLAGAAAKLGEALTTPAEEFTKLEDVVGKFTDAEKQALKSMVDTGNMAGAQNMLMDKLAGAVGGAAGKMATPFDKLGALLGELSVSVGTVANAFFDKLLTEEMMGRLSQMVESVASMAPLFADIGAGVSMITDPIVRLIAAITSGISSIATLAENVLQYLSDIGARFEVSANGAIVFKDVKANGNAGLKDADLWNVIEGDAAKFANINQEALRDNMKDMPFPEIALDRPLKSIFEDEIRAAFAKNNPIATDEQLAAIGRASGLDSVLRLGGAEEQKMDGKTQFAGAMEMGSAAAYSAIVQAMGATGDSRKFDTMITELKNINKNIKDKGVTQNEAIFVGDIA
jgi:hypothetical protein